MRSLITRSFVYSFSNLPMMLEGDSQRKIKDQRSLPAHQTPLRDAEVMEQVVTMRQWEVMKVVLVEVLVEVPVMTEVEVVMPVMIGDGRTSDSTIVVGVMSRAGVG